MEIIKQKKLCIVCSMKQNIVHVKTWVWKWTKEIITIVNFDYFQQAHDASMGTKIFCYYKLEVVAIGECMAH